MTRTLLDVRKISVDPADAELPRGQEVLARRPHAERVEVASHGQIPELAGDAANADRGVRIKTEALVLGVKQSLTAGPTAGPRTSSRRRPRPAAPPATSPSARGSPTR